MYSYDYKHNESTPVLHHIRVPSMLSEVEYKKKINDNNFNRKHTCTKGCIEVKATSKHLSN